MLNIKSSLFQEFITLDFVLLNFIYLNFEIIKQLTIFFWFNLYSFFN